MRFKLLAAALLVAACQPAEPPGPDAGALQPGDLVAGPVGDGLNEREPDLCGASAYQQYLGQPGSIVPSLGVTRVVRVVEFGGIVTQEYDPYRMNFWLAPTGEIQRISCG